jgi:outer membrane protein assembly factor BamB
MLYRNDFRSTRLLCGLAPLRGGLCLFAYAMLFIPGLANAQHWDRFRGPDGAGQSDARTIPVEWQPQNFLWKRPLAGIGHSSPVIWDDRIFLTSADPQTAELMVLAFNAINGAPLWERRLPGATYEQHAQNSFASGTPAVDRDRVYVLWRTGEMIKLAAFTHSGEVLWQRDVDDSDEKFGFGASPVLAGDIVFVVNDIESESSITGVDRATGEIRWQFSRPSAQSAFSTPCPLDAADGRERLITTSTAAGVTAVDPATGRIAWQALEKQLPERCVSSPIAAGGLVLVSCGRVNNGLYLIALRPGPDGSPPEEAYRIRQGVPNVPTPVVAGDLLFLWHDKGIVACHDLATGQLHWRERIGGNFNSSPIRVGNRIYCVSRAGEAVVLAADKRFQLLARNSLEEPVSATPAVAHGRMYLRTEQSLMCIGEAAAAGQ